MLERRPGAREMSALDSLPVPLLREDKFFICSIIQGSDYKTRTSTLEQYVETWEEARDAEPNPIKKENAGRRAANSYLRAIQGELKDRAIKSYYARQARTKNPVPRGRTNRECYR